jgi:hypothetical protein
MHRLAMTVIASVAKQLVYLGEANLFISPQGNPESSDNDRLRTGEGRSRWGLWGIPNFLFDTGLGTNVYY